MTTLQQPMPITPGSKKDIYWDWTDWLEGDGIASKAVVCTDPLVETSESVAGAVVTAWVEVPEATPLGAELVAACTVTTDTTPPRVETRHFLLRVTRLGAGG